LCHYGAVNELRRSGAEKNSNQWSCKFDVRIMAR